MKLALSDKFATEARLYSEAVVAFARNHRQISHEEMIQLWQNVESTRRQAEEAGIALKEHLETHGCV